ncbi:MAG: flagellar motor protein MotB [Firmicutes bacterium]|nr:flagellar motor protein MotB [Bacillota bacterium]
MSRWQKKEEEQQRGSPLWMTTYSDMVTLLLTFFVMLFAFADIDKAKYEQIAESLRGALKGMPSILETPQRDFSVLEPIPMVTPEFESLYESFHELLGDEELAGATDIYMDERGLVVSFKEKLFFDIGSIEIKPAARVLLRRVGEILSRGKNQIRVEGHTCDLPIRSQRFPSNWELSVGRATNVTRFLIEEAGIAPGRLAATGYAEFRPVAPNDSEENRAKNRRVDIVLLSMETE